jgi:hypothetical protein
VDIQLQRQEYLAERALMSDEEREREDSKTALHIPKLHSFDFNLFKVTMTTLMIALKLTDCV